MITSREAFQKTCRHPDRSSGRLCEQERSEGSLTVKGGGGLVKSRAMLRNASARVESAILHSIPAHLRPPGTPFRMTAFF